MNKSTGSTPNGSPLNGSGSKRYNDSASVSYLGDTASHHLKEDLSASHQLNIQVRILV